ncbi:MAG TPA: uroporphyrinogen-III C-methyltransferase [Bryobacteraceae bacterium]|nr:uroporphyrinogen-III C-methyltransferase [Bryobacteraceae bacterium]
MAAPRGKIYLVGAGPGDPDLLTVKAARVLRRCDVVLYDRLVGKEILDLIDPSANKLDVGKHEGEQHAIQENIFRLLLEHACAGKTVVRLKGGDPLVFGRGAEEWALAINSGIDVELIPGISSAIAVPGLAGIPLTFRNVSRSFVVITGRSGDNKEPDWSRYAGIDTIIILMGVKTRAAIASGLIAAGRNSHEPVAFVERGASLDERVIVSTLGEVAAGRVEVTGHAVFVVGEVVQIREMLLSLQGGGCP